MEIIDRCRIQTDENIDRWKYTDGNIEMNNIDRWRIQTDGENRQMENIDRWRYRQVEIQTDLDDIFSWSLWRDRAYIEESVTSCLTAQ